MQFGYSYWLLFCLLITLAFPSKAEDFLATAEPLVLTLRQGKVILTDGLLAYQQDDGKVYMPFEETITAMGFAINVDRENGLIEGFYLSTKTPFRLDLNALTLISGEQQLKINKDKLFFDEIDFYVELSTLEQWFINVSFTFNISFLFVDVFCSYYIVY